MFVPLLLSLLRLLTPSLGQPQAPLLPPSSSSASPSAAHPPPSPSSRCLHSCIGVLMNLTHQHAEGVGAAVGAGALSALAELLARACCGDEVGGGQSALQPGRPAILRNLDLVTVCFGLLINLTSLYPPNRELLRQTELSGNGSRSSGDVVALLCRIFDVISEGVDAPAQGGGSVARSRSDADQGLAEVTAEDLHEGHQDGEAAIVQVRP